MSTLPEIIRTIRWMVQDTFRQSLHTKLFWVMLGISVVCTVFAGSMSITGGPKKKPDMDTFILPKSEADKLGGAAEVESDGVQVVDGEVSFGFGALKAPLGKSREDAVKFVQLWLAGVVGDSLGVLLALIWTAGFLPTFLEPQNSTVLLAKPTSRWAILVGKYFGVVGFVALQAVFFVGGTWCGLGVATGVWDAAYWLAVPLLVVNFALYYAVSVFIAVCTRSTVAAAFGTLLFWVLTWAMNYTHHMLAVHPIENMGPVAKFLLEVGYWVLPKPLDMGGIFFDMLGAEGFYGQVPEVQQMKEAGKFSPEMSVLASGAFAVTTLGTAAFELEMTDY